MAQPEWGRRRHDPPRKNLLRFLLVLCINFQLLENKRKEQSDSRRRQWLIRWLTGPSRKIFLAALLGRSVFCCTTANTFQYIEAYILPRFWIIHTLTSFASLCWHPLSLFDLWTAWCDATSIIARSNTKLSRLLTSTSAYAKRSILTQY